MPKRIRRDYEIYELRHARVRVARGFYECGWGNLISPHYIDAGDTYLRISETRLPVCRMCAAFTPDDIVETDK
jgi:hypothetical protein